MTTPLYFGACDEIADGKVRGWAMACIGDGQLRPCLVRISTPEGDLEVETTGFRHDLAQIYGTRFGGFEAELPAAVRGRSDAVTAVTLQDGTPMHLPAARPEGEAPARGSLDAYEGGVFRGWAAAAGGRPARVHLLADGQGVGSVCANEYRHDVIGEGVDSGHAGFRIRPPLDVPRQRPVRFTLMANAQVIAERSVRLPAPRVLIVSETENLDDASRRFRCDHLRQHLGAEGFDARVIGPEEFCKKEWTGYDAIVFARFGADDAVAEKVARYKKLHRTKIVYEIDDLVFLPWHMHDLGSVRSKVDDPANPALKQMFARRLRLISMADAAITTTEALAARLRDMGLPVLMLPNMVPEHEIAVSPHFVRGPTAPLRLLCMAGSPTHYRDFEMIQGLLEGVCRDFSHAVELTLLGRFKPDIGLGAFSNVTVIPRVPYEEMLHIIDQHDLCLVPLERTEFNDAKSCLKFIECGARGVPVLASATRDYRRVIVPGENGFVSDSLPEWRTIIEQAVRDKQALDRIGIAAKQTVHRDFTIETSPVKPGRWLREVFNYA